jgi:hypothetical protein
MKTEIPMGKIAAASLIAISTLLFSCKEEDRLTAGDTNGITEEAVTDSYYLDMDDLATVAISAPSEDEYSGGRRATITITDKRFCVGTVLTIVPDEASTWSHPRGVMTVDFGLGCNDQRGNLRTGKLIFTYDKWRFKPGSTVVTTTDNYTINGIRLEGKRTLTNMNDESDNPFIDPIKFNVLLENGKATFLAEGTTANRESDINWTWYHPAGANEAYLSIEPTSEASGTTRDGHAYQVDVFEALIFRASCGIAVDGIKKYVLDADKEITIDYGSGACDKSVVVTVNGTSHTVTVN